MANEVTADVEQPAPVVEEGVNLNERLRDLRSRLMRVHQRAAKLRTQANALNDKAISDQDFLAKVNLSEIDSVIATLEGAGESLAALLTFT